VRVVDLRAEYTVDLLGTEVRHPRLSWRIEGAAKQLACRIRAAVSETALAEDDLLWDSGTVASDATFDIAYGGPALVSMQRVWWSVEVTSDDGTARSGTSWFEAGLLSPDDWRGEWIEAEDAFAAADRAAGVNWVWGETSLDARPHAFRLDFDAPADLVRAEVLIAGKDHLRGVWVNGAKSPLDWHFDWDTYLPFWGTLGAYDGEVRPGRNSVCALVEADTTGFFPVDGGAFAALIRLHRADGSVERIVGKAFRVLADPPSGWTDTGFDAGGWAPVVASTSWAQGDPRPSEPAMLLRTGFEVTKPVAAARLYATALGAYDASINGRPVSDAILAPEITVATSHILYQSYDVTALIAQGGNVLGATVADGFYASPFGWRIERYGFGPAPRRFRAMLRVDYEDGSQDWVTTGPDWKIATSPILKSEIYDGETYDARLVQSGWDAPGFDDSGWSAVTLGVAPNTRLIAQTSPALERMGILEPLSISEPQPGRHVLDFGQNFSGWVRLRARGPTGTTIRLKFAELLNPDGTVDQANLRLARASDTFILAGTGEDEVFEPRFTYHGFRYVEVEGTFAAVSLDDVVGVVVHSACAETGALSFPDSPLLQQIANNALWAQRSNFFAVPTDCPQRDERMGWMGDIQVFLDAAAFNMEVDPFIRRFLLEARAAQRDDGAYPIVVPQPLSFPDVVTAGWSEAGIILPWQLWQRYGDTAVIDENWAAMEAWMAFVARSNPDHIWREDRGLDLGDWLSVDAIKPDDETTPRVLCATAYWAWSAQLMAEMAEATGRGAASWRKLRAAIGDAFAAEFVSESGICGNGSQTSLVLSLAFGLVPDDRRAAASQVLADEIHGRGMKLSTGFLGTPYLLDVLADAGLWDEVSGLMIQTSYPSWGYMPEQGATTMWERWNGDTGDLSMNSYNHYAFGAVVGFFWRRLAGIAPAAPGFRRIAVRPVWLPQVGRVSARYESLVGTIATETGGDANGLNRLKLTVPANAIAEVELPAGNWRGVPEDSGEKSGVLRFEIGAGTYEFMR
jgi:alpha-L-rhamnosidase